MVQAQGDAGGDRARHGNRGWWPDSDASGMLSCSGTGHREEKQEKGQGSH